MSFLKLLKTRAYPFHYHLVGWQQDVCWNMHAQSFRNIIPNCLQWHLSLVSPTLHVFDGIANYLDTRIVWTNSSTWQSYLQLQIRMPQHFSKQRSSVSLAVPWLWSRGWAMMGHGIPKNVLLIICDIYFVGGNGSRWETYIPIYTYTQSWCLISNIPLTILVNHIKRILSEGGYSATQLLIKGSCCATQCRNTWSC